MNVASASIGILPQQARAERTGADPAVSAYGAEAWPGEILDQASTVSWGGTAPVPKQTESPGGGLARTVSKTENVVRRSSRGSGPTITTPVRENARSIPEWPEAASGNALFSLAEVFPGITPSPSLSSDLDTYAQGQGCGFAELPVAEECTHDEYHCPSRGEGTYRDSVANPATVKKTSCGAWAVVSECSSGKHHFAKKLVCGKEWCSVCGQDNSAAHKRRQARILPKLQQVSQLGYFVIEWPDVYRRVGQQGMDADPVGVAGWCYSKADLRATTNTIVDTMAGERCGRRGRVSGYFARGLVRWHWYGEQLSGKWNPHLNVLVDFDSLSAEVRDSVQPYIEAYKLELRSGPQTKKVLRELWGIECYEKRKSGYMPRPLLDLVQGDLRSALNCPDLIVHYSYFDKPGQIVQKARYITKATFKDEGWDRYMADELYGFRNMRWWGNWKGEPVWELSQAEKEGEDVGGLEAVRSLQEGVCPDCGQPLKVLYHNRKTDKPVHWAKAVDSVYLLIWGAREIAGTGYYRIPHKEWAGHTFSPDELLRLEQIKAKHLSRCLRNARVRARGSVSHADGIEVTPGEFASAHGEECHCFDHVDPKLQHVIPEASDEDKDLATLTFLSDHGGGIDIP